MRRTLVAEFLEGETVLAYIRALERAERPIFDRLDATGFDSHRLASNIIDNFLGDVFQHGMFHADLHPANLMILPDNVVGYIDFGITGTISRFSRRNLIALTLAYTRGDIAGMCQSFFRVSAMDSVSSGKRFREGLQRASSDWYAAEGGKRRLRKNFTLVMLDMLKLSRASGVWPERDVIKYIRSAIAIDGLITRLAPGFNLGDYLQAVCERYLKWDVRSSQFNFDSFAGSAGAMERLAGDGVMRAAGLMRRLASNELPARLELVDSGASGAGRQRRALNLALAAFGLVALMTKTMGAARLGINLFTAEALVAAVATGMLLITITQLCREE
jgi:ubiquinone biosynthesis protein